MMFQHSFRISVIGWCLTLMFGVLGHEACAADDMLAIRSVYSTSDDQGNNKGYYRFYLQLDRTGMGASLPLKTVKKPLGSPDARHWLGGGDNKCAALAYFYDGAAAAGRDVSEFLTVDHRDFYQAMGMGFRNNTIGRSKLVLENGYLPPTLWKLVPTIGNAYLIESCVPRNDGYVNRVAVLPSGEVKLLLKLAITKTDDLDWSTLFYVEHTLNWIGM